MSIYAILTDSLGAAAEGHGTLKITLLYLEFKSLNLFG